MSKINFKCFGDNIYSLLSPSIKAYTTLKFDKESVIKQIKSGTVEYSNIELRKDQQIYFLSDFYIIDVIIKSIKITIPDDKEYFMLEANQIIIQLELKSFDDNIIETQIKDMLKEMGNNFIKEAVASMDKNSKQPSFWDNISESLYKNLIFNMRLYLKDVTINLTRGLDWFTLSFNEIDFSNETGITKFQGAKISLMTNKDRLTEYSIIDKCSFETHYNKESHLIKLHTDTMKFNINPKAYQSMMNLVQESEDNKNKLKCFKRKMTAKYSKPKLMINDRKNYYINLWKYAITTVGKLRKYCLLRWYTAFDLNLNQYEQLAIEYYNDNTKEDNLLLMKKYLFLLNSKNKAKEMILQDKQKPSVNPLMNIFFKKNTPPSTVQEPVSLSTEEQAILDEVYSRDSIKKFIKGKWSRPIFLLDKLALFMSKISFDIFIQNFNLCINNNHSTLSFNLNQFNYDFIVNEEGYWWKSYNVSFNDIGNYNSTIYQEKTNSFLIKIKSYEKTNIEFGFKHLLLNKELIDFFRLFSSYKQYHYWNNAFIKKPRKKEFQLNEYTFDSIPNISIKHKDMILMLKLYSFGLVNPSEISIDFELKEKSLKNSIIARNKIVLSYYREEKNKYILQLNDLICFISMPIVQLVFELMANKNISNSNSNDNQLNEDIQMNNIDTKHNEEDSFDFKYNDLIFRFESQLGKLQLSFIENESKHSLMLTNIQIMQRDNEIMLNIGKSYISLNNQSTILFSKLFNYFFRINNRSHKSNSIDTNKQSSNEMSILFQTQENIIEFEINKSTIQLITNNMMILNKNSIVSFSSKANQLTFVSYSLNNIISLIKMNNNFAIEYKLNENIFICNISNPLIQLDLPIIDQLIDIAAEYQLILKKTNFQLPSSTNYNTLNKESMPLKYEIQISTPKMMFSKFKFEMNKLEITNDNNPLFLNIICENILMSNEKKEIIKETKISIRLSQNRSYEQYCEIYFNCLQIYFLQQDITNLINSFDVESINQKYQRITRLMTSNEYKEIDLITFNGLNNSNDVNKKRSTSNTKKHLFINIPKWDVDFSLNTKEKLLQVSSEGILLNVIQNQEDKIEIEFKIISFFASFNQFNNTQCYLISQNTELSSTQKNPNVLIDLSEFAPQYQLSVSFKDNLLDINISSIKLLLRIDAFFAIYSYFINAIPVNSIYSQVKQFDANMKIRCLYFNSSFVLRTSFDNKESLIIQIDQLYSLYQPLETKMHYGQFFLQINSLRGEFVEESKIRKLIYSKNDFLIFKCHILPNSLEISMVFDTIVITLSYKDIISLLKSYHIGWYYFEKQISNSSKEEKVETQSTNEIISDNYVEVSKESNDKYAYQIAFEIGGIDITLIDNLQNSYYPFFNFNMNKLNIDFINDQIDISVIPSIYSYNYISCEWEPSLEPFLIQLQYKKTSFSLAQKKVITCYVNQDILINLSDMNISLTWGALSRWIELFLEEKKSYEKSFESSQLTNIGNQIMITDNIAYLSKISNNNIRNISGNEVGVIYQGNSFVCPSGNKIDLEYVNEIESNGNTKEMELIYLNHRFKFPIEKMGVRMHRIDADCFFISEISLTKQLSIEISIYSPVIFHNKSQYGITIVFNDNHGDSYFMLLPPKSKQGVPFNHLRSTFDIYFSNIIPNSSQSLNVPEILNTQVNGVYKKSLHIENKFFILKLVRVLQNVRKLVINPEYVIVNYLPGPIIVSCGKNSYSLKKSSVMQIDFLCGLKFIFSIQIDNDSFYSNVDNFFSIQDKVFYIGFKNKAGHIIYVNAMICEKETQKVLVLYSEYLIKNNTGIDLQIKSKTKDNSVLCFKINRDVYMISANPDIKNSWFSLSPYCFQSHKIFLKDLLSETSEYSIKMLNRENNKVLHLNIQTNVSYMPKTSVSFTEMICTVIFEIQPICKITNLLENKWIFICSTNNTNDYIKISPLTSFPFHFFNNGKDSRVCFGIALTGDTFPTEWTDPLYINRFNLYTCCVFQNIFNVEIRQNNGENIIDVFITKSTANNSKILINNQTQNQIAVFQKNNDSHIQIINPKKKEQFNIYSFRNNELTFVIVNQSINIHLSQIKEPNYTHLHNNTVLYTESNGLKTYFTFYDSAQFNTSLPEAKQFNFDLNFTKVYISLIGDNKYKDKKLVNYIRNEILLLELKNIQVQILQKINTSLLNKYNSQINASLGTINIYNQISTYGKFAVVLSNSNDKSALTLNTDCDLYPNDKICKMNTLNCNISKLYLGIDPNFVGELIQFVNNVIYRMNIINFNVDDLFINTNDYTNNNNKTQLLETYQANSVLYRLSNFTVPQIDFSFELSKIGLKSLLKRQFNFSTFLSSVLANLAGDDHSIKLDSYYIYNYLGTIDNLVTMIFNRSKRRLFSECNKIGFKGVLLGITNFFKQKEQESDYVKIHRRRLPRPFYGQYKSIKKYDEIHAYIYQMMNNAFGGFNNSYHFTDGIKTTSSIILFTTMSLFIFNLNNQLEKMIDYFYIQKVEVEGSKVIIEFNQKIDNRLSQNIIFTNNETAEVIAKKLTQSIKDCADPIQTLN